jgi:hypothetical protein
VSLNHTTPVPDELVNNFIQLLSSEHKEMHKKLLNRFFGNHHLFKIFIRDAYTLWMLNELDYKKFYSENLKIFADEIEFLSIVFLSESVKRLRTCFEMESYNG